MTFALEVGGTIKTRLLVSEKCLEWLYSRRRRGDRFSVDSERNAYAGLMVQREWLTELDRIIADELAAIRTRVGQRSDLPHDPQARELVIERIARRDEEDDVCLREVRELIALIQLAIEEKGELRLLGD